MFPFKVSLFNNEEYFAPTKVGGTVISVNLEEREKRGKENRPKQKIENHYIYNFVFFY